MDLSDDELERFRRMDPDDIKDLPIEEKKPWLAHHDPAWDFEETVTLPATIKWRDVMDAYNDMQQNHVSLWRKITGSEDPDSR